MISGNSNNLFAVVVAVDCNDDTETPAPPFILLLLGGGGAAVVVAVVVAGEVEDSGFGGTRSEGNGPAYNDTCFTTVAVCQSITSSEDR